MNLYCVSEFNIGLFGTFFLTGTFVGSFIFPRLGDVKGRKPIFLVGLVLYIATIVAALFTTNMYFAYAILFVSGVSDTAKFFVGYVYAVELMPKYFQDYTGMLIFVVMGLIQAFNALTFWFVYKDWRINAYIAIAVSAISFVMTIISLPESPRFLHAKDKSEKTDQSLIYIMKSNKKVDEKVNGFRF